MNTFTAEIFEQPRLREQVTVAFSGASASLDYREQGCTLDFPEGTETVGKALMLALKQGGRTVAELKSSHGALADEVLPMLRELDALGLLTESSERRKVDALRGRQFYRELYRMADRAKRKYFKSRFYEALLGGTATKNHLIGYAIEYYHLVAMAPTLLAPALAYVESPRSKALHFTRA